jgi:hypothetical protein
VVLADASPIIHRYRQEQLREPVLYEQGHAHVHESRYNESQPITVIRERPPPQSGDVGPTFVRTVPRREVISLD